MSHLILVAPPRSGASLLAACLLQDSRWSSTALSNAEAVDDRLGVRTEDHGFTSHFLSDVGSSPLVIDGVREFAARTTVNAVD